MKVWVATTPAPPRWPRTPRGGGCVAVSRHISRPHNNNNNNITTINYNNLVESATCLSSSSGESRVQKGPRLSEHQMTNLLFPSTTRSPASLAHSALFAGYYSYLTTNVVRKRLDTGLMIGEGEPGSIRASDHKSSPADSSNEVALKKAVRAHGNFVESTPFPFFLVFLAELNGAPTSHVHISYAVLFLSRVAHAEFGIRGKESLGWGRPVGTVATLLVTFGAGLYNLKLGWEPLKSFLAIQ